MISSSLINDLCRFGAIILNRLFRIKVHSNNGFSVCIGVACLQKAINGDPIQKFTFLWAYRHSHGTILSVYFFSCLESILNNTEFEQKAIKFCMLEIHLRTERKKGKKYGCTFKTKNKYLPPTYYIYYITSNSLFVFFLFSFSTQVLSARRYCYEM